MQGQISFGRRRAAPRPAAMAAGVSATAMSATAAPLMDTTPDDDRAFGGTPWASLVILTILGLVFMLELADAPGLSPTAIRVTSQLHLGAVSRDLVLKEGQAWRLLTAPWLHQGLGHIAGNGLALVLIGLVLEPIIGWRWLCAVYALGGIAGTIGSITLNQHSVISVGASGAIMALMACAAAISFHPAAAGRRMRIWRLCVFSGIPALLPTVASSSSSHVLVDYSAHMGGAAFGAVAGLVLLVVWNRRRLQPPFQAPAMVVGLVVSLVGLVSVGVAAALPRPALPSGSEAGLIPPDQLPASDEEGVRRAEEFVSAYPDDPRGHLMMALAWSKRSAPSAAEIELQKGLASPLLHAPDIPPELERRMRILLVGVQIGQREFDAARESAEPLCPEVSSLDPRLQKAMTQLRACEGR